MAKKSDPPYEISQVEDISRVKALGRLPAGKTAAALGLDIAAAENGKWWKVLPGKYYYNYETYPTPTDKDDLRRLAMCGASLRGPTKSSPGKHYLKRCEKAWKVFLQQKQTIDLDRKVQAASEVVSKTRALKKEAKKELDRFKEEIQEKIEEVQGIKAATLGELYELAGKVGKQILTAFLEGTEINGKVPTIGDVNNTFGKVFGQVARLGTGVTDDAKEEAKEVVFQEAQKEIREKMELITSKAVPVKGTDTEQ